ncbi:MAG: hypothetical protein H6810_13015 [Phycisphaeraceae bacterium]|nr:MAG: hypothetical protein H6810_13015 [Phycisphaeraceae bacterium]
MSDITGYRVVRALSLGPRDSSFLAVRPGGSAADVVIERCEPTAACETACADALGLFLERRALQRRWAGLIGAGPGGLGRGHVVAVHDLGVAEWGGYAVCDRYDASVGDLLNGKARPRGDALLELFSGIVAALRAIESAAGRPHGDFEPEAVLIEDLRPGRMRVGLRNPLPGRLLDSDLSSARRDELRRLGLMLYELVVRRPFRELGGYPVRDSEDWRALGPDHAFWLELVNALLDPKSGALTLDEVAGRLAKLKHRKPGPGPVVIGGWAAAVLVAAAGIAFLVKVVAMPSGPPQFKPSYDEATFLAWCRASVRVHELREQIKAAEGGGAPEVLAGVYQLLADEGVEALKKESDYQNMDLDDLFDPPFALVQTSTSRYRYGKGDIDLISEVVDKVKEKDQQIGEAKAKGEDTESESHELDLLGGVATRAMGVLQGSKDPPEPGLAASFLAEKWEARRALESKLADWGDDAAWAVIAGRITDQLGRVDQAVAAIVGVGGASDETAEGESSDWSSDGRAAAKSMAQQLVEAAGRVESIAKAIGEHDTQIAELQTRAAAWKGLAALGGLPDRSSFDAVRTDPMLEGLPRLVDSLQALDADEPVEALSTRLQEAKGVLDRLDANDGLRRWRDKQIDALKLRELLGDAYDELKKEPPSGDAGQISAWVTRRLALCEQWLTDADQAGAYPPGASPKAGLKIAGANEPAELEKVWNEALAEAPEDAKTLAGTRLQGTGEQGPLEGLLAEYQAVVERVRSSPDWPSLKPEFNSDISRAEQLEGVLSGVVAAVADEVLANPEDVIAKRQSGELLGDEGGAALGRVRTLEAFRNDMGNRMIADWRDRKAKSTLPAPEFDKQTESKAFCRRIRAFEKTIGRAAPRVLDIPSDLQSVGGYKWDLIEPAVVEARAEAVAAALGSDQVDYAADRAGEPGGVIDGRVGEALKGVDAAVEKLNEDLAVLAGVEEGLDRCELPGMEGRPGPSEVTTLLGRLDGPDARFIAASTDVQAVKGLADRVLTLAGSDDLNEVVATLENSDAAGPAPAARFAAMLRADGLASQGKGRWPDAVGGMRAEADLIGRGLSAIKDGVASQNGAWGPVSAQALGVLTGWWTRGFAVATDEADLRVLVSEGPGWLGVLGDDWAKAADEQSLKGEALYDAVALRVRDQILTKAQDVKKQSASVTKGRLVELEGELKEISGTGLAELRTLGETALDDAGRRSKQAWIDAIEEAIAKAAEGKAAWDPNEFGPAKSPGGWTAELNEPKVGSPSLTYTKQGGKAAGTVLRFDLVELDSNQKVFLAADEMSVGMLDALGDGIKQGAADKKIGDWVSNDRGPDTFKGPCADTPAWQRFGDKQLTVSPKKYWLGTNIQYGPRVQNQSFPPYADKLADSGDQEMKSISQDPEQGSPSVDHPISYIPYDAASAIAAAVGCRLPTVDEFTAALREVEAVLPARSGAWNLRDAFAYSAQLANYRDSQSVIPISAGNTHYEPGAECYFSDDPKAADRDGTWVYGGPNVETTLWFQKVGAGNVPRQNGVRFRHLIGNVAEWVDAGRGWSAMGASALSPPEMASEEVVTPRIRSIRGYADTGFRLAIDADDYGDLATTLVHKITGSSDQAYVFGGG